MGIKLSTILVLGFLFNGCSDGSFHGAGVGGGSGNPIYLDGDRGGVDKAGKDASDGADGSDALDGEGDGDDYGSGSDGSGTDGIDGGTGSDSDEGDLTWDQDEISSLCESAKNLETVSRTIVFPELSGSCPNAAPRLSKYVARVETERELELPKSARVCSVAMNFPTKSFSYDDEFLLTFGDVVLFGSQDVTEPGFWKSPSLSKVDENLFHYSWDDVVNTTFEWWAHRPYCVGAATGEGNCSFPRGRLAVSEGPIDFQIDDKLAQKIFNFGLKEDNTNFKTVVMGNNVDSQRFSPGDCYHSELEIEVEVKLLK